MCASFARDAVVDLPHAVEGLNMDCRFARCGADLSLSIRFGSICSTFSKILLIQYGCVSSKVDKW
jgi:hypothetical protein